MMDSSRVDGALWSEVWPGLEAGALLNGMFHQRVESTECEPGTDVPKLYPVIRELAIRALADAAEIEAQRLVRQTG